jgi:hypothetical protein
VKSSPATAIAALSACTLSGCIAKLDTPVPPMQVETEAIAASYDNPIGSVDISNVGETLGAVNVVVPSLFLDWLPDFAAGLLTSFDERIQGSGLPTNPDASVEFHHFTLSAVVDLQRICAGWDSPPGPPNAAANGTIDATAIVENGRLDAEVWGTAIACKIDLTSLNGALSGNGTLDGALILLLLGPLPTSVSNARFLFTFSGKIAIANQMLNSSIDFRIFDGRLDLRVPVSNGDIVAELGSGSSVTLRGSNGTFLCDLTALSCQELPADPALAGNRALATAIVADPIRGR